MCIHHIQFKNESIYSTLSDENGEIVEKDFVIVEKIFNGLDEKNKNKKL